MSGKWDIQIDQGADFSAVLTWNSDGQPVDLTGWSAHMQVRSTWGQAPGSQVILDLSTGTSGLVLGATAGTISITIPNAATTELQAPAHYSYDLKMTSPSGQVTRLLSGSFTVSPEVTV